jgi:hypothetical protein
VAAAEEGAFFEVFFVTAPPTSGDVRTGAGSSKHSGLPFCCFAILEKPTRSSETILKNPNMWFVGDPFNSTIMSLYSFGEMGSRMKSPCSSTFLFFSTENSQPVMDVTNVKRNFINSTHEVIRENEGRENSQADVKPKALVQSGQGMPLMSTAQASSAIDHPSSSGHTGMVRYSSTMSPVLYLRVNRQSIIMNSSPSGQVGFLVYES